MSRFFSYRFDHIIFWILTVFFHAYTRLPWIEKAGIGQFVLELFVRNGLLACAIYVTLLFSIPRLTNGKQVAGILGIVFALLVYVVGKNAHDVYFYGYVVGDPERQQFFYNTFYNLSIVTFYLAFATTLHLSKQWYLQREKMRQIEMEKLNTELEYLRAQINPHFLFNSINTIYFQIDKQNTSARETLEKFSEMLRYQLYECTEASISLQKEMQYLKNFRYHH
jgi:two-component system, LytTR family, sensor kinase